MAVEVYNTIRSRLREWIRDGFDLEWTDAALDDIINEAQRECALFTGALVGREVFTANESGVLAVPDDFIEPVRFVSVKDEDVPVVSWRALARAHGDFRKLIGREPAAVCFDFDGFGLFRTFPQLPAGSGIGTLYYRRLPRVDVFEKLDYDAITEHALYQLFTFEGKEQAGAHYEHFLKLVNREARSSLTTRDRRPIRRGVYY